MGLRMRLKGIRLTPVHSPARPLVHSDGDEEVRQSSLADNGSNWYISGETNEGWSAYMDDLVSNLKKKLHGQRLSRR